jgi:MFS family permease
MDDSAALDPRRWAALAVLLTGAFLAPLDFFIVNVALPSITAGIGATPADVQLVISGYAVVYAVCLITGGRLGDIWGRKIVFLIGLAAFALASGLCGLAWSPRSLIVGRVIQALAAAAMAPQALASVHALFPPHERGRALSIFGITIALASVAGQLLGGALVTANIDGVGWRLIFLINLPVSAITFAAAIPLLRETRGAHRPRLDLGGVLLSGAALSAFVVPLIEGRERGWPWWCIVMLLASPLLGEAFRRYEVALAATGGEPLIDMAVFRAPGLRRGLLAIATIYMLLDLSAGRAGPLRLAGRHGDRAAFGGLAGRVPGGVLRGPSDRARLVLDRVSAVGRGPRGDRSGGARGARGDAAEPVAAGAEPVAGGPGAGAHHPHHGAGGGGTGGAAACGAGGRTGQFGAAGECRPWRGGAGRAVFRAVGQRDRAGGDHARFFWRAGGNCPISCARGHIGSGAGPAAKNISVVG